MQDMKVKELIKLGEHLKPKMTGQGVVDVFGAPLIEELIEQTLSIQKGRTDEKPVDGAGPSVLKKITDNEEGGNESGEDEPDKIEVVKLAPELTKDFLLIKIEKVRQDLIQIFNDNEKKPLQKLIDCYKLIIPYIDNDDENKSTASRIGNHLLEDLIVTATIKALNDLYQKNGIELLDQQRLSVRSFSDLKIHLQGVLQSLYVGDFLKALEELKDKKDTDNTTKDKIGSLEKRLLTTVNPLDNEGDKDKVGNLLDVTLPKTYYEFATILIAEVLDGKEGGFNQVTPLDQLILKEACHLQDLTLDLILGPGLTKNNSHNIKDKYELLEIYSYDLIADLTDFLEKKDKEKAIAYLNCVINQIILRRDENVENNIRNYITFAQTQIEKIRNSQDTDPTKLTDVDYRVLSYCEEFLDLAFASNQVERQQDKKQDGKGKEKDNTNHKEERTKRSERGEEQREYKKEKKKDKKEKKSEENIAEKKTRKVEKGYLEADVIKELNKTAKTKFIEELEKDLAKRKKSISEKSFVELSQILTDAKENKVANLDWCRRYVALLAGEINDIEFNNRKIELLKNLRKEKHTKDDDGYKQKNALLKHLIFVQNWLDSYNHPYHFLCELNRDNSQPHRLITPGKHKDTLSYVQLETNRQKAIYRLNKYKFKRYTSVKLGLYDYLPRTNKGRSSSRVDRISAAEKVIDTFNETPFKQERKEQKNYEKFLEAFKEAKKNDKIIYFGEFKEGGSGSSQQSYSYDNESFYFGLYQQIKTDSFEQKKNIFIQECLEFQEFLNLLKDNLKLNLKEELPASELLFAFNLYKQVKASKHENIEERFLREYEFSQILSKLLDDNLKFILQNKKAKDPEKLKLQAFNLYKEFYELLKEELNFNLEDEKIEETLFAFNLFRKIKSELDKPLEEIKAEFLREYRLYNYFYNQLTDELNSILQTKSVEERQNLRLQAFSLYKQMLVANVPEEEFKNQFLTRFKGLVEKQVSNNSYEKYRKALITLHDQIKKIPDKGSKLRETFFTINDDTYRVLNQANTKNPVVNEAIKISNTIYHQKVIEKLLSASNKDEYLKDKISIRFLDIFKPKILGNKLAAKIQSTAGYLLKYTGIEYFNQQQGDLTDQKTKEFTVLTMLKNYLNVYDTIHSTNGSAVVEYYIGFLEMCALAQSESNNSDFKQTVKEAQEMVFKRLNESDINWLKPTSEQRIRMRKAMMVFNPENNQSLMTAAQRTEYEGLKKNTEEQINLEATIEAEKTFERIVRTKLNNYFYAQKVISTGKFVINQPKEKEFTKLLNQVGNYGVTAANGALPGTGVAVGFVKDTAIGKLDELIDEGHNKERENAASVVPEGKDADEITKETARVLTIMYLDPIRRIIHTSEIEKFAEYTVERVTNALKIGVVKEEGESNLDYSNRLAMATRDCDVYHTHGFFETPIQTKKNYAYGSKINSENKSEASKNAESKEATIMVEDIFTKSVPMTVDDEGRATYYESENSNHLISSLYGFVVLDPVPDLYQECESDAKYGAVRANGEHQKVIAEITKRLNKGPEKGKSEKTRKKDKEPAIENESEKDALRRMLKEKEKENQELKRRVDGKIEDLAKDKKDVEELEKEKQKEKGEGADLRRQVEEQKELIEKQANLIQTLVVRVEALEGKNKSTNVGLSI